MSKIIYLIISICIILSLISMFYIKQMMKKYSKYRNGLNMTGKELVEFFLLENNLEIKDVKRSLDNNIDHYDIKEDIITLSSQVYDKDTVLALAIATHECGHVLQNKNNSWLLKLRNNCSNIVISFSYFATVILSAGYLIHSNIMVTIAAYLLCICLLFQFVTLPIEIDASNKALKYLEKQKLDKKELKAIKNMLIAASLTYLASLFFNIINMFKNTWKTNNAYAFGFLFKK